MMTKINSDFKKEMERVFRSKKFNSITSSFSAFDSMSIRRSALEKLTGKKLAVLDNPAFDISAVSSRNCENLIGKIDIPLGISGPLKVKGDYANGDYFIPLATSEGALVASVSRGCKALSASGGVFAYIEKNGITRAPVFRVQNLKEAKRFQLWLEKHGNKIKKLVGKTDRFLSLLSFKTYLVGRYVYLRLVFNTGDAMGMNMVTFACDDLIGNYIEKETGIKCISLSANVCSDKKPSWINKIEGRGYGIHAEAVISEEHIKNILKTTSQNIYDVYLAKILIGSSLAGSMAYNAHHANIIAAIFAATGQDLAHISEASLGTTFIEKTVSGMYISVFIPDLPLGTVGGGTELAAQKATLSILGVDGGGKPAGSNAKKFAEIVAGAVLAGEISLIASLAEGSLAKAHRKLGR